MLPGDGQSCLRLAMLVQTDQAIVDQGHKPRRPIGGIRESGGIVELDRERAAVSRARLGKRVGREGYQISGYKESTGETPHIGRFSNRVRPPPPYPARLRPIAR